MVSVSRGGNLANESHQAKLNLVITAIRIFDVEAKGDARVNEFVSKGPKSRCLQASAPLRDTALAVSAMHW
jgi:hypothetical protein